jgi:sugar phosphate isomerase/epimerase
MATRRKFLGWSTAALGSSIAAAAPIDPLKRTGRPVFKLSLAAYSMRQFLDAKPDAEQKMDLLGLLDYAASLGVQGVEPTSYYFPKDVTSEYLNTLKRHAHIRGLDLSGGAIRNDFCRKPGTQLDADKAHCDAWISRYSQLGVRAIRVFAGTTPKGDDEKEAVKRCIDVLERQCAGAERFGVFLALENHGGVTAKVETMLEIVKAVQSPWFGVNLDSGNFKESADPYSDLAKIAPYAVNAQIKIEITRKVDGKAKTEETDYRKVIQLLKEAGYTGWIALEYEGKEDPYAGIPKALDKLRSALAAEGTLGS